MSTSEEPDKQKLSRSQAGNSMPANVTVLWKGELLEGKLLLAADPPGYYPNKSTRRVYFRIESADMYLEGVLLTSTGMHSADSLIQRVLEEWAKFTLEYHHEYPSTVH